MHIRILLFATLVLSPSVLHAQSKSDFTLQLTIDNKLSAILISISRGEVPVNFSTPANVQANTTLYRLVAADTPSVHAAPIPCAFNGIDPSDLYAALFITPSSGCAQNSSSPLPLTEDSYLLEIKAAALVYAGPVNPQPKLKDVYIPFTVSKEVSEKLNTAGNIIRQHENVRLTPDVPVNTTGLTTVQIHRVTLKLTPDHDIAESTQELKATYIVNNGRQPIPYLGTLEFKLQGRLSDAQQYLLRGPDNLVDAWGRPLKIEGKLKLPDIPKSDDSATIAGTLSMQAAVHQAAVFTLTGKYAPLTRDYLGAGKDHPGYPGYPDYWDPSLNVDVGLRSTKSANSIIALGLYRHWIDGKNCAGTHAPGAILVAYQNWLSSSPTCLSDVRFAIGPRLETDRNFKRLNTLAEARFDFDFYRWHGAISDRKKLILADLKTCTTNNPKCKKLSSEADYLNGPDFGFSLVPYLELDGGAHANTETVSTTKPVASETVPAHGIFRVYTGATTEFDYKWATLKLDASMIEIARPEIIGYTTTTGVALRHVSGIQPHFKTTFDWKLDPAGHYSWNITFENGRSAPNFEYLNKVSSGIKLLY